jgi:hypothetical protein
MYLDIYRMNHPEGKDLTYLKDEENRKRTDKGSCLDKFLLSEDLCIKEIEFSHTRDHFYTILNIFNTENAELTKIYEDRNIIVVPLLQRIADIERERKENKTQGRMKRKSITLSHK